MIDHAGQRRAVTGRRPERKEQQLAFVAFGSVAGVSCDACEAKYPWPRLSGRRGTSTPPDRDAVSSSARGAPGRFRRAPPPAAGQGSDRPPRSSFCRSPPGGERQNDERGGLSDPWPAAGGGARRNRPGAPRADEETASRSGGVDVPRRPDKRGQGYFASHASQLTPATLPNATNASCCSFRSGRRPVTARRCPAWSIIRSQVLAATS